MKKMVIEEKINLLTGEKMHTKACDKLDIPSVEMSDGPSGVRCTVKTQPVKGGDVAFPTASAQAATWNGELVRKIGNQIALNCLERGINLILAPAINIHRNPLCGRNYEYFSEDPLLSGIMGAEYVKGVQEYGVGTSLKHFAANHQEMYRGVVNAEIDERTLREIYLYAFEYIVKNAKPTTLMSAYNKLNGIYCSENKKLLTKILRDEWGFDGMVISDWGAVHNPSKSIKAGNDFIMPENPAIVEIISEDLKAGRISESDIDKALGRVVKLCEDIKNLPKPCEKFDREKAHKVALDVAREAIVLLKNDGNILPINTEKVKNIGVLGNFAKNPIVSAPLMSSGGVTVDESSVDITYDYIEKLSGDANIIYEPLYQQNGGDITFESFIKIQKVAKQADMLIIFAGNHPYWEVEGEDRDNLDLPRHMMRLIEECCRFCKNTVVVLQTGAPVAPFMRLAQPKAIVQMWYTGEAGGRAVAEVLFGKVNPSGKLPMTFMKTMNPEIKPCLDGRFIDYSDRLFVGYRYYDLHKEDIWYPFGHGLSYTEFKYSNINVKVNKMTADVKFDIENCGEMAGKEACQVYVRPLENSTIRPFKELKGFAKVELEPQEKKTVNINLDERAFAYYSVALEDWHVESGMYEIMIGASSQDIRLKSTVKIVNENDYTLNRQRWGDATRSELVGNAE